MGAGGRGNYSLFRAEENEKRRIVRRNSRRARVAKGHFNCGASGPGAAALAITSKLRDTYRRAPKFQASPLFGRAAGKTLAANEAATAFEEN